MQLPGTQIQATKRVFCLALAPSSRLRCLLKQPRWPFRLEYHKTAPSWVQPCIPLSRLARDLTKQTKIRPRRKEAHTALRRLAEAVGTGRTRGGYGCGRSNQRGGLRWWWWWGGALRTVTTLLPPCTPPSPFNLGFLALKSHSEGTCSHCKKLWQELA